MKNLRVFAKRKDSNEKLQGTGINIIGDTAILYNQYASYEVDPETILLRADNNMEKYENPQTSKELTYELHQKLVQTVIDFLREHDINDIEEVSFGADGLQISKQYARWTPATDSSLTVIGYQDNKRKEINYSI